MEDREQKAEAQYIFSGRHYGCDRSRSLYGFLVPIEPTHLVEYVTLSSRLRSQVNITASKAPSRSALTDTLRLRQPSSGNGSPKVKLSTWNCSLDEIGQVDEIR